MLYDVRLDFQDAPGIAAALIYSGCFKGSSGHPCRGCHNPELWNFTSGEGSDPRAGSVYSMRSGEGLEMIEYLVLIGGEPLDQNPEELIGDILYFRSAKNDIKTMLYTGYDSLEEADVSWRRRGFDFLPAFLSKYIDMIKIGRHDDSFPSVSGSKLSSGNQKTYRLTRRCLAAVSLDEIISGLREFKF